MVERPSDDALSLILKAASDPTRRAILTILAQEGPQTVSALAARFEMSLNSVSKHIKVLEGAGLVSRRTEWRVHYIEVQTDQLEHIDAWFKELHSIWAQRLEALDQIITKDAAK